MAFKIAAATALVATVACTPAFSATINLEFVGTAELAPVFGGQQVLKNEIGSNTDFLQIKETTVFEPGQFNGTVKPTVEADFSQSIALSYADNTNVSLNMTSLTADLNSFAGVSYKSTGTFRWNAIPFVVPGGSETITILDFAVGPTAAGTFDETSFSNTPFATSGSTGANIPVPIFIPKGPPGVFLRYRQSEYYFLDSALTLSGMTGSLTATNRGTGSVQSVNFTLGDDVLNLNLDLSEAGTWDLELESLALENQLISSLTVKSAKTFGGGIEVPFSGFVGESCGNPATAKDNGSLCLFDVGNSWVSESALYRNAVSASVFTQMLDTTQFGSITVYEEITPVPLPAGFPLYLAALGALTCVRRKRKT